MFLLKKIKIYIKNKIKIIINKFLSKFNLKLVSLKSFSPHILTQNNLNILSKQYLFDQNRMVVNVDLAKGRTSRWFDMSNETIDPDIYALKNALKNDLVGDQLYKFILKNLYYHRNMVNIKNIAEFLDIEVDHNSEMNNYPWWAEVKPWDNLTFKQKLVNYPQQVKNNRMENGFYINVKNSFEIMKCDYENSLPSHAKQYSRLTELIKKNGFQCGGEYGYVNAEIFVKENELYWKTGGEGNHRAIVAAALNLEKLPVIITKIIRLNELKHWPNVVNGLFTEEQANKIFNSIFNAKPAKIHSNWIRKVKNKI